MHVQRAAVAQQEDKVANIPLCGQRAQHLILIGPVALPIILYRLHCQESLITPIKMVSSDRHFPLSQPSEQMLGSDTLVDILLIICPVECQAERDSRVSNTAT